MRFYSRLFLLLALLFAASSAEAQWVSFDDETASRLTLVTIPAADNEEKDLFDADFDLDGWNDVIVVRKIPFSNPGARKDVLLMNENGVLVDRTLQYAPDFSSAPTDARDVFVDDFDGDGWQDIIIANTFHGQPRYYANLGNDGGGNWQGFADESSARLPFLAPAGQDPGPGPLFCAVWTGDVDGINGPDIYFSNYNPGGTATEDKLLINDGTGVFTDETTARLGSYRNVAFGSGCIIADMNDDGAPDILKISTLFSVPPFNARGIFLLFNDGTGVFDNITYQTVTTNEPYMLAVGDVDNNDLTDVFIVSDLQDEVARAMSTTATSVNFNYSSISGSRTTQFGGNVRLADIDNDGDLDAGIAPIDVDIANCGTNDEFALCRNDGTGSFSDPYGTDQNFHDKQPHDFLFMDIDRDGCLDMFRANCDGYEVFIQTNCAVSVDQAMANIRPFALRVSPNPFSRETVIRHTLATEGFEAPASIQIFDVSGRLVRRLWSGVSVDAPRDVVWDGRDDRGQRVTPEVYFVRMTVGDQIEERKLVLIR